MAQPLTQTSDIPSSDTYPAPSPEEYARGGHTQMNPSRLLPEDELVVAAQRVGTALGGAVRRIRQAREQMEARVSHRMREAAEQISGRSEEVKQDIAEAAQNLKASARARIGLVQRRSAELAEQKPFQIIAVAAGVAFCAGIGLRVWRSYLVQR